MTRSSWRCVCSCVPALISYLPARACPPPQVRLYEYLFTCEDPASKDDWLDDLNPDSLTVVKGAFANPNLATAKVRWPRMHSGGVHACVCGGGGWGPRCAGRACMQGGCVRVCVWGNLLFVFKHRPLERPLLHTVSMPCQLDLGSWILRIVYLIWVGYRGACMCAYACVCPKATTAL